MNPASPWRSPVHRALLTLAALVLVLRLATLGSYPLMDTSEARYGEIARVMLATGNYVTPQEVPGTPFWAKPPLYAWLSAASMRMLGINEFALRLPSFLCALIVLALCWSWASRFGQARAREESVDAAAGADADANVAADPGSATAILATALLSTSVLFFVSAGAVMTDPSLAACITAMLVAFDHVVIGGSRSTWWRYGFFVAAGLAMLAKGPVLLLYAGAPILAWTLWHRRLSSLWSSLPWVGGTLLAAAIFVPWYALAERRTPGFLNYFLLGEHVMRFLKPGWGGDLYGTAHAEPLGTIWVYLAAGLGVSVLLLLAALATALRRRPAGSPATSAVPGSSLAARRRFALLAVLIPVSFFTFAGNIIWTYNLPALGPLSVLLADFLAPRLQRAARWRAAVLASVFTASLTLAVAVVFWAPRHVARHSSAALVAQWRRLDLAAPGLLLYLGRKAPASLRYYAEGEVTAVPDPAQALQCLQTAPDCYFALAPGRLDELRRMAAALPGSIVLEPLAANSDLVLVHARSAPGPALPRQEQPPSPPIDTRPLLQAGLA